MSGALLLIGAPGSGKSAVLDALSAALETDDIPFGAIETEQLARGWPWLTAEQWMPQLAAVIELQRKAGRETFLVVATTETERELRAVIEAVDADRTLVVCLIAPPDLAARRVAAREPDSWRGKAALVEHARQLATAIPALPGIDVTLPTEDRVPAEVAGEIRKLLLARGILAGGAN